TSLVPAPELQVGDGFVSPPSRPRPTRGRKGPLVQEVASCTQRLLQGRVRPGNETVERHRDRIRGTPLPRNHAVIRSRCKATSFLIETADDRNSEPPEGARDLGARAQAEPSRAAEAGEGAARDSRRIAGPYRHGLGERSRGRRRPPPMVGPLPRQAEGRDLHAPAEDSEWNSSAGEA